MRRVSCALVALLDISCVMRLILSAVQERPVVTVVDLCGLTGASEATIRRDIARGTTIKAGGFKICLELIVRSGATRLVEIPYRFDDRELRRSYSICAMPTPGEVRVAIKRDLGLRRAVGQAKQRSFKEARDRLSRISKESREPVLVAAAKSFEDYEETPTWHESSERPPGSAGSPARRPTSSQASATSLVRAASVWSTTPRARWSPRSATPAASTRSVARPCFRSQTNTPFGGLAAGKAHWAMIVWMKARSSAG